MGAQVTELNGQIALVTGASRGIGRATALRLAQAGAHVIAHYGASREAADALAAEVKAAGGKIDLVAADLERADGATQVIEGVGDLGIKRIDILVSNAGVASVRPIEQQTIAEFDRHYAVNVRTPYFLVQQALPLMSAGARIILLSSTVARSAPIGASLYASTKGAIDTLIRCLAAELGPRGIRVNGLAPGAIETDMAGFLKIPAAREATLGEQALKRIGQPEDVADAILFLASDQSRWVTGRTLEASGGARL